MMDYMHSHNTIAFKVPLPIPVPVSSVNILYCSGTYGMKNIEDEGGCLVQASEVTASSEPGKCLGLQLKPATDRVWMNCDHLDCQAAPGSTSGKRAAIGSPPKKSMAVIEATVACTWEVGGVMTGIDSLHLGGEPEGVGQSMRIGRFIVASLSLCPTHTLPHFTVPPPLQQAGAHLNRPAV